MSVNTYLDGIASSLITKGNEKDSIDRSFSVFKSRMIDYFREHESVDLIDVKIFGSYKRDTNLTSYADPDTDVDIMLVLEDDCSTPQTYLDRVRRAVEAKYSTSEIKQSSPTIVLQMQHIKFEITPAIYSNFFKQYKIKGAQNGWIYTDCTSDLSNISTANRNNYYKIKPVIRLVKYWNVTKNRKSFSSYQIEQQIVNHYLFDRCQFYNTKEYLYNCLCLIRVLAIYDDQKRRLERDIEVVRQALQLASDSYEIYAEDLIKSVIGEF